MKITNEYNIPAVLQVWLGADNYDYVNKPKYISATTLEKSAKQIILASRVKPEDQSMDMSDLIATKLGEAVHESIEAAWIKSLPNALKNLSETEAFKGVSPEDIVINPQTEEEAKGKIVINIEQRAFKEIDGFTIGGKFDFVGEGKLHDFKTTSAYTWMNQSRVPEFVKQGSIYRWLNPELITSDDVTICYIFTDWSKASAKANPKYPQCRVIAEKYPLLSMEATEHFIRAKLALLNKYWDSPEEEIPDCNDEELWRTPDKFKYYSKPGAVRATKVFDNMMDAVKFQTSKSGVGEIRVQKGSPRACMYCKAACICQQRKRYEEA